jgi:hypothetical protein
LQIVNFTRKQAKTQKPVKLSWFVETVGPINRILLLREQRMFGRQRVVIFKYLRGDAEKLQKTCGFSAWCMSFQAC